MGLHYLVSDLARGRGIPYIEAATRAGAWGGVVARVAGTEGAPGWLCYQVLLEELREGEPSVAPAADPAGLRQPLGCADPTFTVRGSTSPSTGSHWRGWWPAHCWTAWLAGIRTRGRDVAILNLRAADGHLTAPAWQTWPLKTHPKCPKHRG